MNLILDSKPGLLPVIRANGEREYIAPWQLTTQHETNPIIKLNAPRPDFNGALMQLLIGLIQTTFAPNEDRARARKEPFKKPPSPEQLQQAFTPIAPAFEIDGENVRFLQDIDSLEKLEPKPITALLIDTAGSETHFVKHAQTGFCATCAVMALFTLQTNAPSGGVGHRTSLRGGGPLTTILVYSPKGDIPASLWRTIWLNILTKEDKFYDSDKTAHEHIFSWLDATRTSNPKAKGCDTTLDDVHPLQMFWGMPRRIRLDTDNTTSGECAICGTFSDKLITHYRTKNYGVNYTGSWDHPLTPYSIDKKGQWLPVHPKSGGITYRHWLGLVQENKALKSVPAKIIDNTERFKEFGNLKIWAFGYNMDNMKPICWYESTMPLYYFPTEEEDRKAFMEDVENLINAATEILGNLRSCLKNAWFSENDPRKKGANMAFIDNAFWQNTESCFYTQLAKLQQWYEQTDAEPQPVSVLHPWHRYLHRYTLTEFDRWANCSQIAQLNPKRIAAARSDLFKFNYKKSIKEMLRLPKKDTHPRGEYNIDC